MKLFGRKKTGAAQGCCCAGDCSPAAMARAAEARGEPGVKILGAGCRKCNALEEATRQALAQMGMETHIEHVTDFAQIASYGVMRTPALVVDGRVLSYGRVLKPEQICALLQKTRAEA